MGVRPTFLVKLTSDGVNRVNLGVSGPQNVLSSAPSAGCSLLSSKESSKEALPAANYFLFIKSFIGGCAPKPPGILICLRQARSSWA